MITYLSNGNAYSYGWSTDNIGNGSAFMMSFDGPAFSSIDINGDGKSDLIRIWDNNGRSGIATYLSDGVHGYTEGWSTDGLTNPAELMILKDTFRGMEMLLLLMRNMMIL